MINTGWVEPKSRLKINGGVEVEFDFNTSAGVLKVIAFFWSKISFAWWLAAHLRRLNFGFITVCTGKLENVLMISWGCAAIQGTFSSMQAILSAYDSSTIRCLQPLFAVGHLFSNSKTVRSWHFEHLNLFSTNSGSIFVRFLQNLQIGPVGIKCVFVRLLLEWGNSLVAWVCRKGT